MMKMLLFNFTRRNPNTSTIMRGAFICGSASTVEISQLRHPFS